MKKLISTCILISTIANAQWLINDNTGARHSGWTFARIGDTFNPSQATAEAAGWRDMTAQELADWEVEKQVAASNAAAQASLPMTFDTGIAVMNEAGHWVEFIPDGTNVVAETLAIQISNSPLDPETRNQMKLEAIAQREAKRQAAREAKAHGNLQARIEALEALQGVE